MRKKNQKFALFSFEYILIILLMVVTVSACVGCGHTPDGAAKDSERNMEDAADGAKGGQAENAEEPQGCRHVFEAWDIVEATCSQPGTKMRRCKECGMEERVEIPLCGHVADETGMYCKFCKTDFPYTFVLKEMGTEVETHTDLQLQYLSGDSGAVLEYAAGMEELGGPKAVNFSWDVTGVSQGNYVVQISLSENFDDAVSYATADTQVDVRNLYIASDYFWRVQLTDASGETYCSPTSTFSTTDVAPRVIYVEGVSNVRDLGGWVNEDGKRIRQGMIYRSGQLNMNTGKAIENTITENGMDTMVNVLKIKTELDLRSGTGKIKESPLPDVAYVHYPMKLEATFISDYSEDICEIFHILADEENYPIDMHCVVGTDRTGAMAYLIHGLLGMTEEDLERDYLYSNFANIGGERTMDNISKGYVSYVNEYEGASQSEKIYNCLLDIGVPKEDLDAVRNLLIEE